MAARILPFRLPAILAFHEQPLTTTSSSSYRTSVEVGQAVLGPHPPREPGTPAAMG